jgi:hypothetical protein
MFHLSFQNVFSEDIIIILKGVPSLSYSWGKIVLVIIFWLKVDCYFNITCYDELVQYIIFKWLMIEAIWLSFVDKGNNKITELRAILQRESQNS